MELTNISKSLADFQMPDLRLFFLDPYNNTFGEYNWIASAFTILLFLVDLCTMFLLTGKGSSIYDIRWHGGRGGSAKSDFISKGSLIKHLMRGG